MQTCWAYPFLQADSYSLRKALTSLLSRPRISSSFKLDPCCCSSSSCSWGPRSHAGRIGGIDKGTFAGGCHCHVVRSGDVGKPHIVPKSCSIDCGGISEYAVILLLPNLRRNSIGPGTEEPCLCWCEFTPQKRWNTAAKVSSLIHIVSALPRRRFCAPRQQVGVRGGIGGWSH